MPLTPLDNLVIKHREMQRYPYAMGQTAVPIIGLNTSGDSITTAERADVIEMLAYHTETKANMNDPARPSLVIVACHSLGTLLFNPERVFVTAFGDVCVEYAQ